MLSLSTAWNSQRQTDPRQLLNDIKQLGFEYVELGYNFPADRLEQLMSFLPKIPLKVSSVHNYCPCPDDGQPGRHVSNLHFLSALDPQEREKAIFWTKKSIDTADRIRAKVLVIHAGTIMLEGEPERNLIKLYQEGKTATEEFIHWREDFRQKRKQKAEPYLMAIEESFKEILPYAAEKAIKIGLETRYYPHEIPNVDEVEFFLQRFASQGLVYWHDNGHAEVNERLGLAKHLDYLNRYSGHLYGMHIHGVRGLRDHLAPFAGDFDLDRIMPFIRRAAIKVIESHESATPEELRDAIKKLS